MKLISHLHVEGFRSIHYADIPLRPLNVLIGANGAGKSNLIDFFRMLNYALSKGFQDPYQRERGPASAILHYDGSRTAGVIRAELSFKTEVGINTYRFTLADSQGDRLTFTKEEVQFHKDGYAQPAPAVPLIQAPSNESGLTELWAENDPIAKFAKAFLRRCRVYQFHDTSITSRFRDYANQQASSYLYADGGNLAALLLSLRSQFPEDYASIRRSLTSVLPWFDDFILEPEGNRGVLLRWRLAGKGGHDFQPSQLSDGSLRIMALVSLLLLPEPLLPQAIILDEPELGLHPAAEAVIAGLIKDASRRCQIILSTQSATFLDHFAPDDVIVVESEDGRSRFLPQSAETLRRWLDRYTLGQAWSKNLLGGRP